MKNNFGLKQSDSGLCLWDKAIHPRTNNLIYDFMPSIFKNGLQVYNNNKKLNDLGKNDFWQSGFVHPELVLQDLSLIFQKDSQNDKKLIYYKKIL